MSDPVLEASQVLAPLLSAGADGALAEITRQAGDGAAAAVRRVLGAVRRALGGENADEAAVAAALRSELDKGTVTESDVMRTVEVFGAGNDNYGVQVKGNVYFGNSIDVGRDFHG